MDDFNEYKPTKKAKHGSSTPSIAIIAPVLGVVLCGLSFYAGTAYQKSHDKSASGITTSFAGGPGTIGFRAGGQGGLSTVSTVSDTSITVTRDRSGTSKTYTLNSSTVVDNNGATGAISDIKAGDTVVVETSTSDTSVATRIILNPQMMMGPSTQQSTTTESGTSSVQTN